MFLILHQQVLFNCTMICIDMYCIFKSSVLFGTHTLLDKSLRVLQLPTDLSNLNVSG